MRSLMWSAQQYTKFAVERTRPVRDLLAALPAGPVGSAVDLGCGSGNSTEALAARYPDADLSGVDSSADMIAAARTRLPRLRFELATIADWLGRDETFDVVLANAVLQWVPEHERLFTSLMRKLAPGGCLGVQMPDNLDEPAHRAMRAVAAGGPWAPRLAAAVSARSIIQPVDRYYEWLRSAGCRVDLWRTTYHHELADGASGVVDWFRGSGLRPFLEPLSEHEQADFLAQYEAAVACAYPIVAGGSVLLPFPRLFIVAMLQ